MYAIPADVATNLGRELTTSETLQAELWIGWAEATIAKRKPINELDAATVQMVVTEAVSRRLRSPEAVSQMSVTVDDATVSRSFQRSTGLIEILPEWWAALGLGAEAGGAFTVTPYSE